MKNIEFKPDTPETRKRFQDLCRHAFIMKLLAEIRMDMAVCELEGWDKMEYINMIYAEMDGFRKKAGVQHG